jgi:hypothetical protein
MKRIFIGLVIGLLFCAVFIGAQKTIFVLRNLGEGETVFYVEGQKSYHAKDCPELIGKNAFATNVWTMRWRSFEPCPKCLYKEIPAPIKSTQTKIDISKNDFRSIAKWEGSAQKNTETFSVDMNEWIINWETRGDSNFAITVYNADTNDMVELVANIIGSGKDYSVIRGKGRYYLKISSSQYYFIEVSEKK